MTELDGLIHPSVSVTEIVGLGVTEVDVEAFNRAMHAHAPDQALQNKESEYHTEERERIRIRVERLSVVCGVRRERVM